MTTHNTPDKQDEAIRLCLAMGLPDNHACIKLAQAYLNSRASVAVVEGDAESKAKAIVEEYKQRVMQLPSGDAVVPCAAWLEMRLRIAFDLAAASSPAPAEPPPIPNRICDYRNKECAAYGQTVGNRWICNNHICEQLQRCWLNAKRPAPAEPPPFMVVTVSEDCREISIEHPNSAGFDQVYRAHVALRDHLNERITRRQNCPFNPSPAEGEVGKVLTTALRGAEQTVAVLNAVGAAPVEPPKFVSEVDQWKHDLTEAGWVAETTFNWRAPDGGLWRGPAGAWKELQRRNAEPLQQEGEQESGLWCDHCSADLNGVKHVLCKRCYREFAASINTRETLRAAILDWLAHRCDRAPVCENCTYCRVAKFIQSVEPAGTPATPSDAAMRAAEEIADAYYFDDPNVRANWQGRKREVYDEIAAIITRHLAGTTNDAERDFLAASVAVWREIDRLSALPEGYKGLPPETDPRKRELAAWERYRAVLDAATTSPEATPNYALVQLLNAAMLHPEQAEGYIRRVIAELGDASPETPVGGEG